MSFLAAFNDARKAQAESKRLARITALFNEPAAVEIMRDIIKKVVVEADTVSRLQELMQEDIQPGDSAILIGRDGAMKADTF